MMIGNFSLGGQQRFGAELAFLALPQLLKHLQRRTQHVKGVWMKLNFMEISFGNPISFIWRKTLLKFNLNSIRVILKNVKDSHGMSSV